MGDKVIPRMAGMDFFFWLFGGGFVPGFVDARVQPWALHVLHLTRIPAAPAPHCLCTTGRGFAPCYVQEEI